MGFGETFKALSDPARREILSMLKHGRMSAGDIASRFDMTAATVSYHLKVLKQADLLYETREKTFIFYELNTSVLEDVLLWIADLRGGDSEPAAAESPPAPSDAARNSPEQPPRRKPTQEGGVSCETE